MIIGYFRSDGPSVATDSTHLKPSTLSYLQTWQFYIVLLPNSPLLHPDSEKWYNLIWALGINLNSFLHLVLSLNKEKIK